jgi:hypothetical protein
MSYCLNCFSSILFIFQICLCITCVNPELKIDKLHHLQHHSSSLQKVLSTIPTELGELTEDETKLNEFKKKLNKLKNEKFNITFAEWQKIKSDNSKAPISTKK